MKKLILTLVLAFGGCAADLDTSDTVQSVCGATACGGLEGESYTDCMNFHCGGDNGGGDPGGGGSGGGGAGTCTYTCIAGTWTCQSSGGQAMWSRRDQVIDWDCDFQNYLVVRVQEQECHGAVAPFVICGAGAP